MTASEHTMAWQAQSLLLDYPSAALLDRLSLLREVTRAVPGPVGDPLAQILDHVERTPLPDLAADYVATFDHRKRGSLYLTYYTYGDTRKRGMALLRFTHAYRAEGLVLSSEELPDHLAVVLEFAAGHPGLGLRLLSEHRAGLELLRLGLHETNSPWASVLDSISATLPRLRGSDEDVLARLIAQGPPEEEVGLQPFGGLR
ncbi:nitrate reductase molybdenum cofactor assembly chaperone [Amycolatopsis pithecellobii]|uniref:Nitrate reductase molybdenum cofactor assembly chaperone n=1 Tax=Amycolatopsis pithecellobii TaxID=664692 RepID=A0A6N7Z3I2_9PSEU|nr:nitrate reductase molybdenum cofactor assembly chaperone [Amycolatopsis pithecellobii]MTD54614.1 nitrate reductase molybdenum cofactor assembly chaperone [Amycolatopsis pithecellobii]